MLTDADALRISIPCAIRLRSPGLAYITAAAITPRIGPQMMTQATKTLQRGVITRVSFGGWWLGLALRSLTAAAAAAVPKWVHDVVEGAVLALHQHFGCL